MTFLFTFIYYEIDLVGNGLVKVIQVGHVVLATYICRSGYQGHIQVFCNFAYPMVRNPDSQGAVPIVGFRANYALVLELENYCVRARKLLNPPPHLYFVGRITVFLNPFFGWGNY